MRHIIEASWIATMPTLPLGEVVSNAARGTFDLIRGVSAVPPKLRDDRTQGANQIQGNGVCNQHDVSLLLSSPGGEQPLRLLPPRLGHARRDRSAHDP